MDYCPTTLSDLNDKSTSHRNMFKDFYKEILTNGIIRNHSFEATITPPSMLSFPEGFNSRIEFLSLPIATLDTADVRYGNYTYKAPLHRTNDPVNIGFVSDNKLEIYQFLQDWINAILYKHDINHISYLDDYVGLLSMDIFDVRNRVTKTVEFYELYPISVNPIDFNKTSKDDIVRVSATFAYSGVLDPNDKKHIGESSTTGVPNFKSTDNSNIFKHSWKSLIKDQNPMLNSVLDRIGSWF